MICVVFYTFAFYFNWVFVSESYNETVEISAAAY